ncbi:TMEM175 family protein [Leucobacter sp. USHLN153]|uniref:TMEM175 family protein n=1 Tax=Leucobacter sp. USHLN153 TaxID=3081268 RepID=UPI003017B571
MTGHRVFGREGAEFGRGIGFLDAIYGFAITLLVTNIDVPQADEWRDLSQLLGGALGPQLLGFFITFVVIAVFWRHNMVLLSRFTGLDGAIVTANLVTAGLIVLLPFTTQGMSDPDISEYPLPTALYAVNVALVIASQWMTLEIGRARGLLKEHLSREAVRASRIDIIAQLCVFLGSVPVAFLTDPDWARLSWLLMIPIGRITGKWSARLAARDSRDAGADRPSAEDAPSDGGSASPSDPLPS